MDTIQELIEASDLDELVKLIDRMATGAEWDAIGTLIERCEEAVERGKQVWPARHYAEYRLARDAPAKIAASVVAPGAGRFAPGPLWEVAASTHTWAELEPYVTAPEMRSVIAQERALRGDEVPADAAGPGLEIPLALQSWEPEYATATYRADGVDVPGPEVPDLEWVDLGDPGEPSGEGGGAAALLEVVRHWLDDSSGRGEAVAVEGHAEAAIRALGPHRVRLVEVPAAVALDVMAWSGAGGGAYGRRRGAPAGRVAAWWAAACLLGLDDAWPVDPAVLGEELATLRWVVWDPGDQATGWAYHLAVEDPDEDLAWAVSAVDAK